MWKIFEGFGGSERVAAYGARVALLGEELDNLHHLEDANIEGILDLTLTSFRLEQTRLLDEIKKQKEEAEQTIDET